MCCFIAQMREKEIEQRGIYVKEQQKRAHIFVKSEDYHFVFSMLNLISLLFYMTCLGLQTQVCDPLIYAISKWPKNSLPHSGDCLLQYCVMVLTLQFNLQNAILFPLIPQFLGAFSSPQMLTELRSHHFCVLFIQNLN